MNTVIELKKPCLSPNKTRLLLISIGAVLASIIAVVLSLAFAHWVFSTTFVITPDYVIVASLTGLLVGFLYWREFNLKPGPITVHRGIQYGILSSLIAHPIMWIIAQSLSIIIHTPSFGFIQEQNIFMYIPDLFFLSLMSLIFAGWLTTIVGAVAGGLIVYLQRAVAKNCPNLLSE
jgi:hypothetical protein